MNSFRTFSLFLGALFLSSCGNGKEQAVIKFTAIPGDNTTELAAKFKPLEKYLCEKLGVKVEFVPTADYAASVDCNSYRVDHTSP